MLTSVYDAFCYKYIAFFPSADQFLAYVKSNPIYIYGVCAKYDQMKNVCKYTVAELVFKQILNSKWNKTE